MSVCLCMCVYVCVYVNRFFVDGKHINTRETAARIVFVDDIFRAMTRQVQYMAIHCTPKNERTQFMYKYLTKLAH